MICALLRGRDHLHYGAVEARSEGDVALALSIGGARKVYAHTDPNEDAAMYAAGPGGSLIAVADGHHGALAAERVLEHLLECRAPEWTGTRSRRNGAEDWVECAFDALLRANAAIFEGHPSGDASVGRTTLSMALVRPGEDLLLHASVGDSHVFVDRDGQVADRAWAALRRGGTRFLGHDCHETRDSLAHNALVVCEPMRGVRAALVATDGLSERGIGVDNPAAAVADAVATAARESAGLRPLTLARDVVDRALEAHRRHRSGDNAATAALWLGA